MININQRNLTLDKKSESYIERNFEFLTEYTLNDATLKIENDNSVLKFKIFFEVNGKDCIAETRAGSLRDGIFRLKTKVKKIINSENRKLRNSKSIKFIEEPKQKIEHEFNYITLESIDKPIEEKDAKEFMHQNKINTLMFANINKDYSVCIMQRKKDKFDLYITNYTINV